MADYHVIKLVPHDRERLLDLFKSETGGPTSQEYLEFLITVPGGGIYAAKDKQGNILGKYMFFYFAMQNCNSPNHYS